MSDCACPSNRVLQETDAAGNYLSSKICATCPSGSMVITFDTTIAGKAYKKDLYSCQYCPEPSLMTMLLTSGTYSCRCNSGYTMTGVSGIGVQSCVTTSDSYGFIQSLSSASTMNYYTVNQQVVSLTLQHYFVQAATRCRYMSYPDDIRYCQILANLCVLQSYHTSNAICAAHLDTISLRVSGTGHAVQDIINWAPGQPWIYFANFNGGKSVCHTDIYQSRVSLHSFEMQYVIAAYFLNGTLQGFHPVESLFTYCTREAPHTGQGGGQGRSTKWQYFATNAQFSYQCELRNLFKSNRDGFTGNPMSNNDNGIVTNSEYLINQQMFYELFLYDAMNSNSAEKYVPVPIRIVDTLAASQYPGRDNLCDVRDQLVRRFYLYDIVSGIGALNTDPTVVRYASYISLQTFRVSNTQRGIYPPALTIIYSETKPADWLIVDTTKPTTLTRRERRSLLHSVENEEVNEEGFIFDSLSRHPSTSRYLTTTSTTTTNSIVSITFQSYSSMDMTFFFHTLMGFFSAIVIIFVGLFCLRYYNWNIRNSRVVQSAQLSTSLGGFNWKNLFEIFLLLLNSYVLIFFPFSTMICWYFFVFFKLQSVPSILLPLQSGQIDIKGTPYMAFKVNLYLMTFFQIAYVFVMLVYHQSRNSLFFIDWEPKAPPSPQTSSGVESGGGAARGTSQAALDRAAAMTMSRAGSAAITSSPSNNNSINNNKVSVWRTILVANEFVEMQTIRRSNIFFTLFFLGFFLLGLNLENNCLTQPNLKDIDNDINGENNTIERNIILRFANTTFFWLILSLAQYLWKFFIYERYISEPPEQVFLDFCTIAKISILCLDERYHGFYLHCRSPHQNADSTMVELVEMLSKEEAGLTVDRSLEGAPSDVQSFQMFLSAEWTTKFKEIKRQLIIPQSINEILDQRRQRQALAQNDTANRGGSLWGVSARARQGGATGGGAALLPRNRYQGIKVGWSMFLQQTLPPDKVIKAWNDMLSFLQEFIENNLQLSGLRYIIHEPTYWELLLNSAPDLSLPQQPSVLYTDRDWNFTRIWFLGNELDLLLFNILTYSMFDFWWDNTLLSILLCYLCDWGIREIRNSLGQVSISFSFSFIWIF